MFFHLGQKSLDRKGKHAAVPVIIALGQIALGRFLVRFLNKGENLVSFPFLNIAVTCLRAVRRNAECYQVAVSCQFFCLLNALQEGLLLADQMICRQHQQNGILVLLCKSIDCCGTNGRRCITSYRLKNDGYCIREAEFFDLVLGQKTMLMPHNNEWRQHIRQADNSFDGGLEQGNITGQV